MKSNTVTNGIRTVVLTRPLIGKSKEEYTKRTLISISKSANQAKNIFRDTKFKIYIIDHNSTKDQIDKMRNKKI